MNNAKRQAVPHYAASARSSQQPPQNSGMLDRRKTPPRAQEATLAGAAEREMRRLRSQKEASAAAQSQTYAVCFSAERGIVHALSTVTLQDEMLAHMHCRRQGLLQHLRVRRQ